MKKCFECNSTNFLHEHHVVPRVLGGTKTIPLCANCHGLVHSRDFLKSATLQKLGIEKAKKEGRYKQHGGRAAESTEQFLNKPKSKLIAKYLNEGNSVRRAALLSRSSLATAFKVSKIVRKRKEVKEVKSINKSVSKLVSYLKNTIFKDVTL